MWVPAGVGVGSEQNLKKPTKPTGVPRIIRSSHFLLHAKVQIFLLLRMVTESVTETVNGQ